MSAASTAAESVFESWGYTPTGTPAFERAEFVDDKLGADNDALVFRVTTGRPSPPGGLPGVEPAAESFVLRYDQTLPLARLIASGAAPPTRPWRRYQVGPVWRADRPARGRFRQFIQADCDLVGGVGPAADAEVISVLASGLDRLGVPAEVGLSDRRLLAALASAAGCPDELFRDVARLVDKLAKAGSGEVAAGLVACGVPAAAAERLLTSVQANPSSWTDPAASAVVADLEATVALLDPELAARTRIDASVCRGLDYYTGAVFELTVPGDRATAVAAGGRYDTLVSDVGGPPTPIVGGAIGIDRVLSLGFGPGPTGVSVDLFVCAFSPDDLGWVAATARSARAAGLSVVGALSAKALRRQFRDADRAGARFVVLAGPDERADETVTLRCMSSGQQSRLPLAAAVEAVTAGRP